MAEETYTAEESWQSLADGHKVFTKIWKVGNLFRG